MYQSQNLSVIGGAEQTTLRGGGGVSTPSLVYDEMMKQWALAEDLRGGTERMIDKADLYLPREPAESKEAYINRLRRSELYNLYGRTLVAITGLPFIKPVVINNVPEQLEYLSHNCDGTGRSVTEFAYSLAIDALHYGVCHAIADYPQTQEAMNLKEWSDGLYRPYFTYVSPRQLIGWREEPTMNGVPDLKNIRIFERQIRQSELDEWNDVIVDIVRVIYKDKVEVYEFNPEVNNENYTLTESYEHTHGKVPLVTGYGNRTGFLQGAPAMADLARINLAHFQVSSDLRNTLHTASVPFVLATGFDETELQNAEISASKIIVSDNPDARMNFIEHQGHAIGSGNDYLDRLEQQAAVLGADLLVSKGVGRMTATARRIDQTESLSVLQIALRSVEQMLENLYEMAGEIIGVDASNVSVSIGDDLSVSNEPNPTNALIALMNTGLMSEEQAVEEAKRMGILSSYFRLSEERAGFIPKDTVDREQSLEELEAASIEDKPEDDNIEDDVLTDSERKEKVEHERFLELVKTIAGD